MYSYSHQRGTGYGGASQSIPLPPGMSPGAIIGKGGSNIKLLQSRSGARVSVNANSGSVDVSGTPAAVEEAVRLLWLQIDAFTATGVRAELCVTLWSLLTDQTHTTTVSMAAWGMAGHLGWCCSQCCTYPTSVVHCECQLLCRHRPAFFCRWCLPPPTAGPLPS